MAHAVITSPLLTDKVRFETTAEALCIDVVEFTRAVPDFSRGPFIYSLVVHERGPLIQPGDPTYVYHEELYAADEDKRAALIMSLAKQGATLDISMCRAGYHAEHKYALIT